MTETLYLIYQKDTIRLVGSLIIKSVATAEAVNRGVIYNGGTVDPSTPASWRYYKNLSGQYHAHDKLMTIVSHDTQEVIQFTKNNLKIHKTTLHNYTSDTQYLNTLIEQYPDQINLIRGILNPVGINDAIDAADGTILYYDPTLVEENETTLMIDVQNIITHVMHERWYNPDYAISDELYPAVFYAVMTASLVNIILNLRLKRCKTPEAHSYHIRQYLASRNGLDRYIDTLNRKQLLWLYRNIDYIRSNVGKQEILDTLIDNILTPRNIPVGEFRAEQNIENLLSDGIPVGELVSFPINTRSPGIRDRFLSVEQMLIKERGIAKGNEDAEVEYLPKITSDLARSGHNTLPTKILESVMVDLGEFTPVVLTDTLYHYWGYLSSTGRYTAVVEVNIGGGEYILSVKDAFVLYTYALYKAADITLEDMPTFYADNILKLVRPSIASLKKIVDSKYVSTEDLSSILADIPLVEDHISTIGFYENVVQLHRRLKEHRLQYSKVNDAYARGMMEGAVNHLYYKVRIEVSTESNYAAWLSVRRLDFEGLSREEWELAAIEIFKKSTGWVEDKTLADIQAGLIGLVERLTSYTIQWIYEINRGRIIPLDNHTLGISNPYLMPYLYGKIRPISDYILSDSTIYMSGEMGEPLPMAGTLEVTMEGSLPPPAVYDLSMVPQLYTRSAYIVNDYLEVYTPPTPPIGWSGIDSESIIDFEKIVLDVRFDEGTLGATIDHSEFNRDITLFPVGNFFTYAPKTVVGGKLRTYTSGDPIFTNLTDNGVTAVLPPPPYGWEYNFELSGVVNPDFGGIFIPLYDSTVGNPLFSAVVRQPVDQQPGDDIRARLTIEMGTGPNYVAYESFDWVGQYRVLYNRVDGLRMWRNGVLEVSMPNYPPPAVGTVGLRIGVSNANSGSLSPTTIDLDNVLVKYYYRGRPWWLNTILALNFEQLDPDLDPGLVISTASGAYYGTFVVDISPLNQEIKFQYNTSRDLVISRNNELHQISCLRYYSSGHALPDSLRLDNFTVSSDTLSIEFTYSHNRTTLGTSTDTFSIFRIEGPSMDIDIRHDGATNRLEILGAGTDWTNGSGLSWIQNPPEEKRIYTINLTPTTKTLHIDGVLALSAPTGTTIVPYTEYFVSIFKSSGGAGSLGVDLKLDDLIVTDDYVLDPTLTRVVVPQF